MDSECKQDLLYRSLERTAEVLGDITAHVYALFYARCPDARARFAGYQTGNPEQLEGSMVEQALYCLMHWYDAPGEVEIVLMGTIPHHVETLGVTVEMFSSLITAVCDTAVATIPQEADDERSVLRELHAGLMRVCAESAQYHAQQCT